jgi:hypothetical protein
MPQLSREEMEAVIRGGGSVMYQGKTLTQIGHLPTEADLAQGNPEAETAAANTLQQQIVELQQQLAKLQPPARKQTAVDTSGTAGTAEPDPQAEKTTKKKAADSGEG